MNKSIDESILKIFQRHFVIPEPERSILDQLSSLEFVHLVTEIEKEFSISVNALEINEESFATLQSLSTFVEEKMAR